MNKSKFTRYEAVEYLFEFRFIQVHCYNSILFLIILVLRRYQSTGYRGGLFVGKSNKWWSTVAVVCSCSTADVYFQQRPAVVKTEILH